MTYEEELKERFSNMDILELEDIVRNKKSEYTEEAYTIASEQFRKRYNDNPDIIFQTSEQKANEEILDEIDKRRNPPMKWYYWLICVWLPITLLKLLSITFSAEAVFATQVIGIIESVCVVASEILLIQKKKIGVYIFLGIISLEVIGFLLLSSILEAVIYACFVGLNCVYFNKRKHLFS